MDKKRDSFFLPMKKEKQYNVKDSANVKIKQQRQENFDKTRNGVGKEKKDVDSKKPFDKKTYRLKKYSKKYKLEKWEEQRKKQMMHKYQKELKNDPGFGSYKPISFDDDTVDSNQSVGKFVRHPDFISQENSVERQEKNKKDAFGKAKEQFNKVKNDKLQKQQEIEKAKEDRKKKLEEYKKQKQERFKKLSKKTKKGQPVMTGRLELLLEKLQKNK